MYVLEVLYFLKCFYRANLVAIIHCVVAECFVESSDEPTRPPRTSPLAMVQSLEISERGW